MTEARQIWKLRDGADRRFRAGHPWVYSNELVGSPKGITPGDAIELQDSSGKFLAYGYGNPASLIAFRALTRLPEREAGSTEWIRLALQSAARLRADLGLGDFSHRLCHGEADGIPGLIIDRYQTEAGFVHVVQAHTAGANRMLPAVFEALGAEGAIVVRNDVGVRRLEGIEEEEPRIERALPGLDLSMALIRVRGAGVPELKFKVDLLGGQKTGFFLDQSSNIELAVNRLRDFHGQEPLRILDLCCYVGQWGAQLSAAFRAQGRKVAVTAVDASEKALALAKANIEAAGGACETLKGDVLTDLERLEARSYDLVICDPPALIKNRKDIPAGTHAYLKVNTQVFRIVKEHGAVVSCSCSGLLEETEFTQALSKAAYRNRVSVRWIGRGGQAPDHPVRLEFNEGRYLKCWIGLT